MYTCCCCCFGFNSDTSSRWSERQDYGRQRETELWRVGCTVYTYEQKEMRDILHRKRRSSAPSINAAIYDLHIKICCLREKTFPIDTATYKLHRHINVYCCLCGNTAPVLPLHNDLCCRCSSSLSFREFCVVCRSACCRTSLSLPSLPSSSLYVETKRKRCLSPQKQRKSYISFPRYTETHPFGGRESQCLC